MSQASNRTGEPAGEVGGEEADGAADGTKPGRIPAVAGTSRGVVVRPYRDPLVLGPLFRDEEADPSGEDRDGPRTLRQPAVGGAIPRPAALGLGPPPAPNRPAASPAGPAPAGRVPAGSAPAGPGSAGPPAAPPAARRTLPPVLDRKLAERPARACSGWWALLAVALAGTGAALLARYTDLRPHSPLPRTLADAWPPAALAACALLALAALAGLRRGRTGHAWVLTLFGRYRGTIRRTGLVWSSPLPRHARVDVRLRHWRSEPLSVVDAEGTALRAVVLVVWRVKDTARALLSVEDHAAYLRGQVESATARVLSRMPADSFRPPGEAEPETLRDTEAVGDELTGLLASECRAVGIEVFSARPLHVEYAPEVAAAMQRRRIAAIDARHRDSVLTSVIDAVDDTVHRMSDRGLVSLDDYERKALVKDLTVAFYTARGPAADAR